MLGVPHDSLVDLCKSNFSAIPAGSAAVDEKPNYAGGTIEVFCCIYTVVLFALNVTAQNTD